MTKQLKIFYYKAMINFIEAFYQRGGSSNEELEWLLEQMQVFMTESGEPYTLDPAMWNDWLKAIELTEKEKN